MGRTATIIAVSYAILGGAAVVALGALVWGSTLGRNRETNLHTLAEREKTWFGIVVVLLIGLLFGTIFFTPYSRGAEGGNSDQIVDVNAQQFAFVMPATPLKAGKEVEFRLTSSDVNHAFAVFDSSHKFLFQVQIIPGKTQLYRYTFEPGVYTVECFEYCGVGHDAMASRFTVTR